MRRNFRLSKHFNLKAFTKCEMAKEYGLQNDMPEEYLPNLMNLCEQVLEPLRKYAHKPIPITCGFLTRQLNELSHGVGESLHQYGEAVDIKIQSYSQGVDWFYWIRDHCRFDQIIWEHKHDGTQCIHVSCKLDVDQNRKMVLRTPLRKRLTEEERELLNYLTNNGF